MRFFFVLTFIVVLFELGYSQDSTSTSLKRLPYQKEKGLQIVYLSLTGYGLYVPSSGDNSFGIFSSPHYGIYVSKKTELFFMYDLIYIKYGSLSNVKSDIFHEIGIGVRYFPLKKLNIFYLESGLQYGNYAIKKSTQSAQEKNWTPFYFGGFGLELLPHKRKYVIDFNARLLFPFDSDYQIDFPRSIGFGFVLKK